MSFFVEGTQENHMKYRKKVVDYLHRNKQEYQCIFETEQELDEYIKTMEKDHVWGGELELSILSKLYKCGFLIHANNRPDISVCNFIFINMIFRLIAVMNSQIKRLII
jgi:OTU domain-containing protein 3